MVRLYEGSGPFVASPARRAERDGNPICQCDAFLLISYALPAETLLQIDRSTGTIKFDRVSAHPYNAPSSSVHIYVKEWTYVVYISATIEPQEKTGTWISETDEHEEWPESFGSSARQGASSLNSIDRPTLTRAARRSLCPPVYAPDEVAPFTG
jgi:hypothetical protein